jgi:hypothetical protein
MGKRAIKLQIVKPHRQRETSKAPFKAVRKPARAAKKGSAGLPALYSRLDKTESGSEESKRIADEIIDAIG